MKKYLSLFLILVSFSFGFYVAQAQASEDSSQENIPKHLEKDFNAEDENIPERIEQVFNTESKENQRERFNKVVERVEKGEVQAWYKLAMIYSEGIEEIGVEKDEEKAFYWMEKVIKEGHHVEAQKQLAKMFKNGIGVDKDEEKALSLLEELANQGDDDAQYLLGLELLDRGRVKGSKAEIKEGFKWIKKAAEQGHISAEYKLNEEIPERIEQVFNTVSKENQRQRFNKVVGGVEKGDVQAWYELAMIYLDGMIDIGVERDEGKALFWMEKAANQNHVKARRRVTEMYSLEMDNWRYLRGLKKAAEDGDARSQYDLGMHFFDRLYYKVRSDLEEYKGYFIEENYRLSQAVKDSEDAKEAFEWIEKSAKQGHEFAILQLSGMYLIELGVKQNKDYSVVKDSVDIFLKRQYIFAWLRLQDDYKEAKKNSNVEEVFELMQRAELIGMPEAIYDLTLVYLDKGSPEEREFLRIQKSKGHKYPSTEKEILERIIKVANKGYFPAQYELGNALSLGVMFEDYKLTSVNRDIEKALYWYKKATTKGHEGAQEALKREEFQDYQEKTSLSKPDRRNSSCNEIF